MPIASCPLLSPFSVTPTPFHPPPPITQGQYPPLVVRELQAQLQALRVEVADLKARVPQLQGAEM